MTASVAERRIKKELQKLKKAGDDVGMAVEVGATSTEWFVTIVGEKRTQQSLFTHARYCCTTSRCCGRRAESRA